MDATDMVKKSIARTSSSPPRKNDEAHYLITLFTKKRVQVFSYKELAQIASEVILFCSRKGDFRLLGYIIMPDHIHILCIPRKTVTHVVKEIKKHITTIAIKYLSAIDAQLLTGLRTSRSRRTKEKYQLWQPEYQAYRIMNERDPELALRNLDDDPLDEGLCSGLIVRDMTGCCPSHGVTSSGFTQNK